MVEFALQPANREKGWKMRTHFLNQMQGCRNLKHCKPIKDVAHLDDLAEVGTCQCPK